MMVQQTHNELWLGHWGYLSMQVVAKKYDYHTPSQYCMLPENRLP